MLESRRRLLTSLGAVAGFVAAGEFALFAQQRQVPAAPVYHPSANAPKSQNAPMGLDGPQVTPDKTPQGEANRQLQASLRVEVDKLWLMTNELREDVMRANPSETLSVTFIKKAQAIEKMAKQIREHAKG
jgi:hypothetical protein